MAKRKGDDPPDDFDENTPPESFYGGDDDDSDENESGDDDMSDFFSDEDMDDIDDEELEREMKERDEKIENHPITRAAEEIYHLTEALIASLQPKPGMEDIHSEDSCSEIRAASMMLGPKIAGAMAAHEYTIAMQNAAIIRDNAEYLRLCTNTMHHFYNVDKKHLRLHRSEMEKFRKLFIEWVQEIKTYEKLGDDEWGLF